MRVLITGGAGFIGQKLAKALISKGTLAGPEGVQVPIQDIVLADTHEIEFPQINEIGVTSVETDVSDADAVRALITPDMAVVYHLAAIVSGQAEREFDFGYRVNLDGTLNLLEACRSLDQTVRFIMTSSCATFGGPMPDVLSDDFELRPRTSYGTQKAIGELLVNDYSRKGFIDGRALRLPTVTVRPGEPNAAASSFVSSIIREPLQGEAAVCPVEKDLPIWVISPRRVVECLMHANELNEEQLKDMRSITLPGITVTPGSMMAALDEIAGADVVDRIEWKIDPVISHIAGGWPGGFEAKRASALGFKADKSIHEIIQAFIDDDIQRPCAT